MSTLISEIQPNPTGGDPGIQPIELSGVPGETFDGVILNIESDLSSNPGDINSFDLVSGTFDADGLLVVTVPNPENPSNTIVLLDAFTGDDETDIDADDDGIADDLSAFGTVLDAIGVPDAVEDEVLLYGEQLGGTDFAFTGDEPQLVFREASTGSSLFAINDPDNGQVFDVNGNDVTPAIFAIDPIVDSEPTLPPVGPGTFGTVNPSIDGTVLLVGDVAALEGDAGATTPFVFTVDRLGDTTGETTVDFAVTPVEADAADFGGALPGGGTLTFAAGVASETLSIEVAGDADAEFLETFTVTLSDASGGATIAVGTATGTILGDDPFVATIPEIQGDGFVSPFADTPVATTGLVSAVAGNGFYLLDPAGDGNAATSDGIFVATGAEPTVAVGDDVSLAGTVVEAPAGGLTVTQIADVTELAIDATSTRALPAPVLVGGDGLLPPTVGPNFAPALLPEFAVNPDGTIGFTQADFNDPAIGNAQSLQPDLFAADFYESLEGVVVTLNDAIQVSETDDFGQIYALVDRGAGSNNFNARGSITLGVDTTDVSTGDSTGERIQIDLDDALVADQEQATEIFQGTTLGNVTGVVNYSFGEYEVLPTETVVRTPPAVPLAPEVTALAGDDDTLLVAAYNVLNLDAPEASDDPAVADRFDAIAAQVVTNLNNPDVIALQEIQDNDGPDEDGVESSVVAADVTLQLLVDAIADAGGPAYEFIDNTFIGDDTNGGQPGGNIRTAFLYDPARVEFVPGSDRPTTDPVTQADGIAGNNPFEGSRIPLAADFVFNGEVVTVVSVHNQAGGANDFGNLQPRFSGSTDDRNQETAEINNFVDDILAADPEANVIVAGDFNDFEFQDWVTFLDGSFDGSNPILFNAIETLPELEQYSFQFTGNEAGNQVILDHIFATGELFDNLEATDVVHVNAEFPNDIQASDHDPVLATFTVGAVAVEETATFDGAIVADLSLATATSGIDFIGEVGLATGTLFTDDTLGEVEIGGLSGLEFDPATGGFLALADAQTQPQRFFTLDLAIAEGAFTDVTFTDAVQILDSDGEPFADFSVDPESIRFSPDGTSLLFSSETGGGPEDIDDDIPFIAEIDFAGNPIRTFDLVEGFAFDDAGTPDDASDDTGLRNNLGFESLSLTPSGDFAFTATEGALFQDGPTASLEGGSLSRVVQFDAASGAPVAQFVYPVDPIPFGSEPPGGFADNGLVEILAVSETEFIFLERSFAVGVGNTIRAFLGDTAAATDVSAVASLDGADFTPIDKTFLFDTASFGIDPDNVEGLTFGPTLADGSQSFFLVSDNNFNDAQFTQFLGFTLDGTPATFTEDVATEDLTGVVNLLGSEFDDFLTGDTVENFLAGEGGDDVLNGGAGTDLIIGGAGDDTIVSDALDTIDGDDGMAGIADGNDTVDFSGAAENATGGPFSGIIIDLDTESAGASGTPSQLGGILDAPPAAGGEVIDLLFVDDVENVIGTAFADGLFGNNEVNVLAGGAGDDLVHGFAGDDFLSGGAGSDTVLFSAAPGPVFVNLNDRVSAADFTAIVAGTLEASFAATGGAGSNVLSGFENVTGSASEDIITGDAGDNVLNGNAGSDVLDGGAGNDTLVGGTGSNVLIGGDGTDTAVLPGNQADFEIIEDETGTIAVINAAADINDTIAEVEILSFDDGNLILAEPLAELVGFAELPAETFAAGPPAGAVIDANGFTGPFPGQPVQGFSGVQFAPGSDAENAGTFLFLSDNGFGSQDNSADYLLRLYEATPNFQTADGGDGTIDLEVNDEGFVTSFIQLADPNNLIPFEIVNEGTDDRLLTGADFDIESVVIAENGDLIIGEEFGPFLLRFNGDGELIEAPIATPNITDLAGADPVVRSPQNPEVLAGTATANIGGSNGFEGLAFSPDRTTAFPLLEGAVEGDPENALRIYEFDLETNQFAEELVGFYPLEDPDFAIGDFTPINANEYLVIERDQLQGPEAAFKQIFKVDLSAVDEEGFVAKELVVDLLNVDDPNDLNGDGETTFDFPFVTIEDVLVLDEETILVANDNNFPFSIGRDFSGEEIDNNEVIQLQLDESLDLDPNIPFPQGAPEPDAPIVGTDGTDVFLGGFDIDAIGDTILAGAGDDEIFLSSAGAVAGDNLVLAGSGDDTVFVSVNDTILGGLGADTLIAATIAGSNTIAGGEGDDTFVAEGSGDRLLGDAGDDGFFFGIEGDNIAFGGPGADLFVLTAPGDLPAASNVIADFGAGTDTLSTPGFDFGELAFAGSDILVGDAVVATLSGFEAETLTAADFA